MGGGKELEGSGGVQGGCAELPHAGTAGPGSERGRMALSPISAQWHPSPAVRRFFSRYSLGGESFSLLFFILF